MVEVPELWRTIKAFPKYEASNKGNIRRIGTENNMLRSKAGQALRLQVTLEARKKKENGRTPKQIHRYVHRLVASCWMLGFDDRLAVGFKDGDSNNCSIWNLEQSHKGARGPADD